MTTYHQYFLEKTQNSQNPFVQHLVEDGLTGDFSVDNLQPRNREIARFMYLLNMEYFFGGLEIGAGELYVLTAQQYENLSKLYQSHYAILPTVISFKGNYFTADNHLKSFPFVDFKQLFIGIKR